MFRSHLVESRFICIKGALVGVEVSAFAISSEGFGWVGDILMRPAETEVLISDPRLWVPAEKFLKGPKPCDHLSWSELSRKYARLAPLSCKVYLLAPQFSSVAYFRRVQKEKK